MPTRPKRLGHPPDRKTAPSGDIRLIEGPGLGPVSVFRETLANRRQDAGELAPERRAGAKNGRHRALHLHDADDHACDMVAVHRFSKVGPLKTSIPASPG